MALPLAARFLAPTWPVSQVEMCESHCRVGEARCLGSAVESAFWYLGSFVLVVTVVLAGPLAVVPDGAGVPEATP